MSEPDALPPEMRFLRFHLHTDPFDLDANTEDRLLDQAMTPDDAPPQYRDVARMIQALADESASIELADEPQMVAGIAAAIASSPRPQPRRSPVTRTFLSPKKIGAAATVGTLVLFGGLTAAGALPGAAQDVAASALENVGITVPTANNGHADSRGKSTDHTPTTTSTPAGADTNADTNDGSDSGKGTDISNTARTTDSTGVDKGAEISTKASDGHSQAGQSHPSADAPPVPPVPASTPDQAGNGLNHRPQP